VRSHLSFFSRLTTLLVIGFTFPLQVTSGEEGVSTESQSARGLKLLRTQAYGKADLQVAQFDQLWTVWPEEFRRMAAELPPTQRRHLAFERYGMVADPDDPSGLPLGVVQTDDGGWVMNCLSCHQGKVAGQVLWGVGNSHFAFQTFIDDIVLLMRESGQPANPMLSLLPLGSSDGTTNAQIFSVFLSAMRDEQLNRLNFPRLLKFQHHDLDAPALWNVKHKQHLYIDGFVPKSHRIIMQFTLVPSNNAEEIKQREAGFKDILAWIESLESPRYPWAIDHELAIRGEAIYHRACSECHGSYRSADALFAPGIPSEGWPGAGSPVHRRKILDYPERRIPIEEIGTDPIRLTGMPVEHRRFYRDSWFGDYGHLEIEESPDGYIAPPLDGIWASAPYLHNGSVPTLWHLMNSTERPVVWKRTADGYDQKNVGLEVEVFDHFPEGVVRSDDKRRYFDTRINGKSASGHTYPDDLTEEEKWALIEYLKTL
jgi:hypothetical protein